MRVRVFVSTLCCVVVVVVVVVVVLVVVDVVCSRIGRGLQLCSAKFISESVLSGTVWHQGMPFQSSSVR